MIISNDLEDAAEKAVAVAEIYSQASKVGPSRIIHVYIDEQMI